MIKVIKIKDIVLKDKRAIDKKTVELLVESIRETGLINPITINENKELIAGFHRIEAYKIIGFEEIECRIMNLKDIHFELAVIDENLIRQKLTELQIGEALKRRKEIYELLFPETKNGISQANGMNEKLGNVITDSVMTSTKNFVKDASEKTGKSETAIRDSIRISRNLTPAVKEKIINTQLADKKTELLELAKQKPEKQLEIVEKIESGEIEKVQEFTNNNEQKDITQKSRIIKFKKKIKNLENEFKDILSSKIWYNLK